MAVSCVCSICDQRCIVPDVIYAIYQEYYGEYYCDHCRSERVKQDIWNAMSRLIVSGHRKGTRTYRE
jgi:hypothetical protein